MGILLGVVGDELVHTRGEADDFGSDVVDQNGAINSCSIKMLEECFRRATEFGNLIEVGALFLHQLESLWLEHLEGLNMDVAVGNHVVGRLSLVVG